MKLFTKVLSGFFALVLIAGCVQKDEEIHTENDNDSSTDFANAVASIYPTDGNEVSGTVTFTQGSDGIDINAEISGLSEGEHGFHIHQYGDCTAADGTSAGGHYAPDGDPHGSPEDANSHDGDLGNITADAEGNASMSTSSSDIVMNGAKSIIGRAVVIHSGADDFTSQPSGAAGSRVACGVIGIANIDN